MNRNKKTAIFLLISLLCLPLSRAYSKDAPRWVKTGNDMKYPDAFYMKAVGEGDSMEIADKMAVSRIGEQIQVSVKSEFSMLKRVRTAGGQDVETTNDRSISLESSVNIKNLEGVYVAERYFDETAGAYFSLAVLEREKAVSSLSADIIEAFSRSEEFYSMAEQHSAQKEIAKAIFAYSRAIEEHKKTAPKLIVLNVVASELEDERPRSKYTLPEIEGKLMGILSLCRIEVLSGDNQVGTFGEALASPLAVRALYRDNSQYLAVDGLPIRFSALSGGITLDEEVLTDVSGIAKSVVSRVEATGVKSNHIDAAIKFDEAAGLQRGLKARFTYLLPIKEDIMLFVKLSESSFGKPVEPGVVGPALIKALKDSGFNLSQKRDKSNFIVSGELSVSKKGSMGKVIFANTSGSVDIIDGKTGNVVSKVNISPEDTVGGGITKEASALSSLKKAGEVLSGEVVMQMEAAFSRTSQP